MICTIEWDTLSVSEWEERYAGIRRSNLLQSYAYARAHCALNKQKARWGLIYIDGVEAGLLQVLEAGIFWNVFHAVILDRGPLWYDGYGGAAHIKLFFDEFNKQFPVRFGRKRRILPEVEDGPAASGILKQTGLKRLEGREGYQTLWLDLRQDSQTLRANLKQKWRNALNKAEKAGLEASWTNKREDLTWLLKHYVQDKAARGYEGPSVKLLSALAQFSTSTESMIVGKAMQNGRPVAGILIIRHGSSATYQVGWTSGEGRDSNAHHFLLWQALNMLQESGVTDFDLGGMNEYDAAGIKRFKEGLGGQTIRLAGHYN